MEQNLVSIITPMYNAERYIAETIKSVQRQTYPYWEMIIMDDVSTDQSAAIAQDMASGDSRIHYFREEEKAFVAKTRNDAMAKAKGRYLAFLDSDDRWIDNKLEKQLTFMQEKDCAFSYGGCDVIDENGNALGKVRKVPEYLTYQKLLWGNVIPCLTVVIDREKVEPFEMPSIGHEDFATWLNILKKNNEAYGINETLGSYRVNRNSVSGHKLKTIKWTWNIYRNEQKLTIARSVMYLFGHLLQAARKMR